MDIWANVLHWVSYYMSNATHFCAFDRCLEEICKTLYLLKENEVFVLFNLTLWGTQLKDTETEQSHQ